MYVYKWRKSHFTRLEKESTQIVNDLFVYTTDEFAIVVTVGYVESRESHHAVLNVYTLTEDDDLKHIQLVYLDAANIFPITLNDGFYFYSLSHSGNYFSYIPKRKYFENNYSSDLIPSIIKILKYVLHTTLCIPPCCIKSRSDTTFYS